MLPDRGGQKAGRTAGSAPALRRPRTSCNLRKAQAGLTHRWGCRRTKSSSGGGVGGLRRPREQPAPHHRVCRPV